MLSFYYIGPIFIISGFSAVVKGEEDIRDVLRKCCQTGNDAAALLLDCVANSPVSGVAQVHQSLCLSAMELCCAYTKRKADCTKGVNTANTGGTCSLQASLDEARCCQACKYGQSSAATVADCNIGSVIVGNLWESTFTKCCEDSLKSNKKESQKESDIGKNMCQMLPNELCHHNCVPTDLSYKCTCRPGWTLMSDGKSCAMADSGKCVGCSDQDCMETPEGEMICLNCPPHYHLDVDNKTCVQDVVQSQELSGVTIHVCPQGYRYNQQNTEKALLCEDIDECAESLHRCKYTEFCVNTIGSYKCTTKARHTLRCRRGYKFSDKHGSCIDIDECVAAEKDDPPCDSNQNCINTNGSFECECKSGFKQDVVTLACIDINECQQKIHECQEYQRCDNTIGSYVCVRDINCGTGYTLNSQSGKCEDDDECQLRTDTCHFLGDDWECKNTLGSFRCVKKTECVNAQCNDISHHCPTGYTVSGSTCIDIDECEEEIAKCGANQMCINIRGSYLCSDLISCKPGLKLNPSKTQCIDVDECSEKEGLCSHFCDNRWGSYRCRCKPGFKLHVDNRTCVDINECEEGRRCQGYCINQQGTYSCSCPPGYRSAGPNRQLCEDINECEESERVCDSEDICTNIAGSYRCNQINCPPGYRRDGIHGNRCQKEDTSCLNDDLECRRQPTTYTYNYIPMVANITVPRSGRIRLFTISSTWSQTAPDFNLELVQVRAPAGVKAATRNDFNLNKQYGKATLELMKPLMGPQEIQLEIKTEFYNMGTILATQISSLEIYVSMYAF